MAIVAASARYNYGIYNTSIYGTANITFSVTGVTATGSVNTLGNKVSELLNSVFVSGVVNTVGVGVNTPTLLASVSTTGSLGTGTFSGTANVVLNSVPSVILSVGNLSTLAVRFNFNNVKDSYSRKRCVYIARAA